jgi:hypothetical protein
MLRPAIGVALTAILLSSPVAFGQTRAEIFGGYSFERTAPCGTSGGGCNFEGNEGPVTSNFNGWEASATGYVTRSLGVTADFTGHYGTAQRAFAGVNGSVNASSYTYLFGPTYAWHLQQITPFVHGLVGGASWRSSPNGIQYSGLAWEIGGGLDVSASRHFAIRIAQVDYQGTRTPGNGKTITGSGWRYAAGVVLTF